MRNIIKLFAVSAILIAIVSFYTQTNVNAEEKSSLEIESYLEIIQ